MVIISRSDKNKLEAKVIEYEEKLSTCVSNQAQYEDRNRKLEELHHVSLEEWNLERNKLKAELESRFIELELSKQKFASLEQGIIASLKSHRKTPLSKGEGDISSKMAAADLKSTDEKESGMALSKDYKKLFAVNFTRFSET